MPQLSNQTYIVHIVPDDKFVDIGLRRFDAEAPGRNVPIMLGSPRALRHVKHPNLLFLEIEKAIATIYDEHCAAVIFHSMSSSFLPILAQIPAGKKVIWIGWGYDYYDRLLSAAFPGGLLLPKTRALVSSRPKNSSPRSNPLRRLLRRARFFFKRKAEVLPEYSTDVLRRVDYFSPLLDIEYEMAVKLNPWFTPKYVCWNYGVTIASDNFDINIGRDILVGNSAAAENNHIETFDVLREYVDIDRRRLIVPLSYAGDEWYVQKIVEAGKDYFGDSFVPLTDYLPYDEYNRILNGCGYAFMNHVRQQGMGNVNMMLLRGAKIYMNPRSPGYKWLLNKGAVLSSIDELSDVRAKHILEPLRQDDMKQNIELINSFCDEDLRRERTRQLISVALSEPGSAI